MFRNYVSIAYRNLLKNKAFSFINIFGLCIGMTAFLLIIHYVRFERSYENFHTNANDITRITLDLYNGPSYLVTDCETHAPMGPMLKAKMPEVKDYVRMYHNDGMQDIKVGTQKFLAEGIYFADPSVFDVFTIRLLQGTTASLNAPMQAVISKSMAEKYFGKKRAVGEFIDIENNRYAISGVMADLPPNTHLKFSILLSHASIVKINQWYKEDSFGGNNEYTYLLMQPGTDLAAFNAKLAALCIAMKEQLANSRYTAEPIKDIHLYSNKTYEPEPNGSAKAVYFLMIIAVFIIVIAWVNYINLSTARAMERAREVGIRKVMGSLRSQLVLQFFSESIIVNVLAGLFAFGVFQSVLPLFRDLTGQPLPSDIFGDATFWMIFIALTICGAMLAGTYPSFVLASFQPAAVLKGKFQSSSHGQRLRKGLVIFQFGATVVLIVCMCTVYLQINYLRSYDLGMDIGKTLAIRAPQLAVSDSAANITFAALKTELMRQPEVTSTARSSSLPGLSLHELSSTTFTLVGDEKKDARFEYYFFSVDADFFKTMDMTLVAGRNFEAGVSNDELVIVNEETVRTLGFASPEEAIGEKVTFRTHWPSESSTIIGVLKNFYQRSPKEKHIPMLFQYRESASYITARLTTADMQKTMAGIKGVWSKVFPDEVLHYFFLDEKYNQQYQADAQFGQVIAIFSALAVFIACLGLFGLSSYTIIQRTKEIGIRKVLGASVTQIIRLLSQDFARVVIIASLLALPVAYFAMEEWLSHYAVRIHMNGWIFALPVIAILLISMITVSFQTVKTALGNPTESLRQE